MSTFFIIISILLNLVSLFVILILYLRQNRLFSLEKSQEKLLKEMDEVISSYLLEIREENEEFMTKIKQMNVSRSERVHPVSEIEVTNVNNLTYSKENKNIEENEEIDEKKNGSLRPMHAIRSQVVQAYKQSHGDDGATYDTEMIHTEESINKKGIEIMVEKKSTIEEILILQKQGYSEVEIAKRLNKGKTEIELLLKFHKSV